MRHLALAALIAAATLAFSAAPAAAKPCGSVKADGKSWIVGGGGVSCKYMRKWTRRMAGRDRKPKGWDKCEIRRDGGGCQRGSARNRDFFIYYPPH